MQRIGKIFLLISIFLMACQSSISTPTLSMPTETWIIQNTQPVEIEATLPATPPLKTEVAEIHFGDVRIPSLIDEMIGDLAGLTLEDFYQRSFLFWISRKPELVTQYRLDDNLGSSNNRWEDLSEKSIKDTYRLERAIFNLLETYDRSSLSVDDQLTYDIYLWFWNDLLERQEFVRYAFPLMNSFLPNSHPDPVQFLLEYQPLETHDDFENFVLRIETIPALIDQSIAWYEQSRLEGIVPSKPVIAAKLSEMDLYQIPPGNDDYPDGNPLFDFYVQELNQSNVVTDTHSRAALALRLKERITTDLIPAYEKLSKYLIQLSEIANDQAGLWQYPDGIDLYEYLIHHYSDTPYSPEQIQSLGMTSIKSIQSQLFELAENEGMEIDSLSMSALNEKIAQETLTYPLYFQFPSAFLNSRYEGYQQRMLSLVEALAIVPADWDENTPVISPFPEINSNCRLNFGGDLWKNQILQESCSSKTIEDNLLFLLAALHTTETLLSDNPSTIEKSASTLFRDHIHYPGYIEAWQMDLLGSVVESSDLSQYEKFALLQRKLLLYSILVVDTGIHQKGWSTNESVDFLVQVTGLSTSGATQIVQDIVINPGRWLTYAIADNSMQELDQSAQSELKEKYNPVEFHQVLMKMGPMPLSFMKSRSLELVLQYQKLNQPNIQP